MKTLHLLSVTNVTIIVTTDLTNQIGSLCYGDVKEIGRNIAKEAMFSMHLS